MLTGADREIRPIKIWILVQNFKIGKHTCSFHNITDALKTVVKLQTYLSIKAIKERLLKKNCGVILLTFIPISYQRKTAEDLQSRGMPES